MIVGCPKCKVKLKVPDESVKPEGSRFKCAQCSTLFIVRPPKSWTEKTPDEKSEGYEYLSQNLDLKSSGVNLRLSEETGGDEEDESDEMTHAKSLKYITREVDIAPSGVELSLKDEPEVEEDVSGEAEEEEMRPEEMDFGGDAGIEPSGEELHLKEDDEDEDIGDEGTGTGDEVPLEERDLGREVDISPSGEKLHLTDEAKTEIIEETAPLAEAAPTDEKTPSDEAAQPDEAALPDETAPPDEAAHLDEEMPSGEKLLLKDEAETEIIEETAPADEAAPSAEAAPPAGPDGLAPSGGPDGPAPPAEADDVQEAIVAEVDEGKEEVTAPDEHGTERAGFVAGGPGEGIAAVAPEKFGIKSAFITSYTRRKEDIIEDRSFFEHIPGAFAYPFAGTAVFAVIGGAIIIWILRVIASVSFFGYIPLAIFVGYLAAFVMKIMSHTASGERKLPEWPEFTELWDDIMCPIMQLLLTGALCFLPVMAYLALGGAPNIFVLLPLILIGVFYYPIAILGVSMTGSLAGINPAVLVPSMFKIIADYFVACFMLGIIFVIEGLLRGFLAGTVPYVGGLIDTLLVLYFIFVEARLLGLMYYANRKKLGWMAVDEVE